MPLKTQAAPPRPRRPAPLWSGPPSRRLATAGMVGVAGFDLAAAGLHLLQPQLDPVGHTVSEYVQGASGWLVPPAMLGLGLGSLALVTALARSVRLAGARAGLTLLAIWGAGITVAALVPSDLIDPTGDTELSPAGTVHTLAALVATVSFAVGAPLLTRRLHQDPRWRPAAPAASALATASVAGFLILVAGMVLTAVGQRSLFGLSERILLVAYSAWLLFVGAWTRQTSSRVAGP